MVTGLGPTAEPCQVSPPDIQPRSGLGLSSLERRRLFGDLSEAYRALRTVSGNAEPFHYRTYAALRGHDWVLFKERCRLRLRACFFTQRVITAWNRLTPDVVGAPSVAAFQVKLDRAWDSLFPEAN